MKTLFTLLLACVSRVHPRSPAAHTLWPLANSPDRPPTTPGQLSHLQPCPSHLQPSAFSLQPCPSPSRLQPSAFSLQPCQTRRGGFTLVEMLVVIVIIAVLVAMLGGAFIQARNHAKRGRAETQLRELTKAWTTYYMTYTNWPAVVANYDGGAGLGVDVPMTYDALTPLFAEGNTKGIPFLSISPSSFRSYSTGQACYTDPWWTPQDSYPKRAYKITFRKSTDYQETALRISVGFPNRDRYR